MGKYRINLYDDLGNEIILTVTTSDDLIEINKNNCIDSWIDLHAPRTRWSKIVDVIQVDSNIIARMKTRVNRYMKSRGRANRDNRIKPGEPNF